MEQTDFERGTNSVSRKQLAKIKLPDSTETYHPISHIAIAEKLLAVSNDILYGFDLVSECYYVGRQGSQVFGVLKFKEGDAEIGPAIAFRNSIDRSVSFGLAMGAAMFPGEGLALKANKAICKHTKGVSVALEDVIITSTYKAKRVFSEVVSVTVAMKDIAVSDIKAWEIMGMLFGLGIISPRQMSALKAKWTRKEISEKTMQSFFNATLESIRTSSAKEMLDKYIAVYDYFVRLIM